MIAPNPLSLVCAILLCLPLALIFTFTSPFSPSPLNNNNTATHDDDDIISINPPLNINLLPPSQHAAAILVVPQINNPTTILTPVEEDEDDELLFQRASRVDPNPKSTKTLAFMFLTTTPLPFAPLWELFFSRAPKRFYNIYVHADPTTANYTRAFGGVFAGRVIPSKPTRRHTPTLTSAARRLLAHALLHDETNSMFALLSPSCIPLHSFAYTYTTLIRSRRSFIEILENEPGAYERWAARGEGAMVPEVEYKDFRIGSQFWVVKRKHARMIVRDRRVWSKFKLPCLRDDTCYPEEQYFPTLLSMVDRRGCIPCTLTHVDWRGSKGGHPRTYEADEVGPELIWSVRQQRPRYGGDEGQWRRRNDTLLFARKFCPESVRRLMSIASDVILAD